MDQSFGSFEEQLCAHSSRVPVTVRLGESAVGECPWADGMMVATAVGRY